MVLELVAQAKDAHRRDDYIVALKSLQKAIKRMQELIALRKEANPDYSVLEAPLFYLQGHFLVSYIEQKSDVFGNLPPLDYEESESEESEGEEEAAEESPAAEEGENQVQGNEEKGDTEEPRIEDEEEKKKSDQEEEKEPANGEQQQQGEEQGNMMVEDAIENLFACIQLSEDFFNRGLIAGASSRKKVLSDLLIDTQTRLGDILLFKEEVAGAIESYVKAVELCSENLEGNERNKASTLFTIGCCF